MVLARKKKWIDARHRKTKSVLVGLGKVGSPSNKQKIAREATLAKKSIPPDTQEMLQAGIEQEQALALANITELQLKVLFKKPGSRAYAGYNVKKEELLSKSSHYQIFTPVLKERLEQKIKTESRQMTRLVNP
ncbi:hypothetical protein ACA910_014046 [Epithemia clementina (nom. ined.)]